MDGVEVMVAHHERVTVRAGETFLKIDADRARADAELAAMRTAPIPTPTVLWCTPPVLALAAVPGTALGATPHASSSAWIAAGAVARALHEAPLPPWTPQHHEAVASELDDTCAWIVANDVLPSDVVWRNRRIADAALRPWTPAFVHGDLQPDHVFVDGDRVTGVIDWSDAGVGDALHDLATLTLGRAERLPDVVAGYGTEVDLDMIRAWWSVRSLRGVRWLVEHGNDPHSVGCEVEVLTASSAGWPSVR